MPVPQFSRLIAPAAIAIALATGGALSVESRQMFDVVEESAAGSFLAGRQALRDLRTEDAASYFRVAAESDWDNPLLVERSFIAFAANGQIADAARVASRVLELDGPHDLAHLVIATEAMKGRRYDDVITQLEETGSDTFAGITGGILKAWAFEASGREEDAKAVLDAIAANGLEDFLTFHRALMADVAGRTDEAIAYAGRAYEADPFVARVVEANARILGNAGRFDEAGKVIAAYEERGLSHPLITAVKEAVADKRRPGPFATTPQAGVAEMFHSVGVALAREGGSEVAALFLRLGMYLDPASDVIDMVFAQLLDGAGQHEAANRVYDALPATSPLKPTAVVRIAENLNSLGDRDEALRRLGNIVATNPQDLQALSVLGDLQRAARDYADAAETYTRALAVVGGDAPADWRFYYVRGIAYERNKEWAKAEVDFKRALELNPDQPQVLNYLGYSWVDQGVNLIPALEMIERAVAAAPNDGYIIDSLGWAFYRLGRFDEAVEQLEKAVRLRPVDPEINDHLGDAYWRAGRELEARFQWNIAASVDTEGEVKARVADKLANGLPPLEEDHGSGTVAESATAPAP